MVVPKQWIDSYKNKWGVEPMFVEVDVEGDTLHVSLLPPDKQPSAIVKSSGAIERVEKPQTVKIQPEEEEPIL